MHLDPFMPVLTAISVIALSLLLLLSPIYILMMCKALRWRATE